MIYLLKSMRPEQWIKNVVVFAGLAFSENLLRPGMFSLSLWAFFIFILASGAAYIINDVLDREADKLHQAKSKRPIAAGKLAVIPACIIAFVIAVWALLLAYHLGLKFGLIISAYLAVNLAYSFYLKNVVIVDVLVIAIDFVLRVIGGVVILGIPPTPWIIIATIFLSLLIALCKRRQEIVLLKSDAALHREILTSYPVFFLDQLINFSAVGVVFSYILFSGISGKDINLMYTTIFVIYGVMRYLYLIYVENKTFLPTEAIAKDRPLQVCVLAWVISVVAVLYLR
jgi:4-hydroxybenzoate polyprenyltransferase